MQVALQEPLPDRICKSSTFRPQSKRPLYHRLSHKTVQVDPTPIHDGLNLGVLGIEGEYPQFTKGNMQKKHSKYHFNG